jgi:hypothetical protein
MIIAPLGVFDPGEQMYHFTTGSLDVRSPRGCDSKCPYPELIGRGDCTGLVVTGTHQRAQNARERRYESRRKYGGLTRVGRSLARRLLPSWFKA